MDSEDDFDHKQLSFSGLAEAMAGIRMQVAADMRMPITKLFGTSVSNGFSTDQNDMENYNSMVESQVRNKLKYDLLRIGEIKCQKLFGFIPDDLELQFKPLRELTAVDEENVKTQKFNRLAQAKEKGEITTQEYRDACNKGNLFDVQLDTQEDQLNPNDPEISKLQAKTASTSQTMSPTWMIRAPTAKTPASPARGITPQLASQVKKSKLEMRFGPSVNGTGSSDS